MKRVFVIGGTTMDITGVSGVQMRQKESNPGHVEILPGGVARNIAENLTRLGISAELITVFGGDEFGLRLRKSCVEKGISIRYSVSSPERTGLYLSVGNFTGEMCAAVSDMDIMEDLTEDVIERALSQINSSDACIIDTNLGIGVIEYIAKHVTVPIFADPVGVIKAEKLRGVMDKLFAIKPNAAEAAALTGIDLSSESGVLVAAEMLVERGSKRAFISLGQDGMVYADGSAVGTVPAVRVKVESRSGAGDAATATLCYAFLNGMDAEASAQLACRASALTIEHDERVGVELESLLSDDIDEEEPVIEFL